MLARYTDSGGTVSKLAHDGVVRLHGLSSGEARELSANFPITRQRPSGAATVPAAGQASAGTSGQRRGHCLVSAEDDMHAEAVRAARAVLEEHRWQRDREAEALKADEEVGLAVLLRGGEGLLSRAVPEEEIAGLPRGGERLRAHDCLVLHNQGIVRRIARRHSGRGLGFDDLVQHGNIGLLRAVRRFDATLGYKFSTYATHCVEKAVIQAIADEGHLVRLPPDVRERVGKVARAERKLREEGRAVTVGNVAFICDLALAEVEEVNGIRRPTGAVRRRRRSSP